MFNASRGLDDEIPPELLDDYDSDEEDELYPGWVDTSRGETPLA